MVKKRKLNIFFFIRIKLLRESGLKLNPGNGASSELEFSAGLSGVALEVLDLVLGVRDDGVAAGGPVGRADLAVLVGVLEGLHKSESFVDGPENSKKSCGLQRRKTLKKK